MLGESMVAISLQNPDDSLTTAERNTLTHHVVSDSNAAASRAYGLVFELPEDIKDVYRGLRHPLPAFNGTGDWNCPSRPPS